MSELERSRRELFDEGGDDGRRELSRGSSMLSLGPLDGGLGSTGRICLSALGEGAFLALPKLRSISSSSSFHMLFS
jgi:hypothetical protein